MLLAAAAAISSGADAAVAAERARQARARLEFLFALDTLEYLRKGGRIGGAQAWLGSALKIKPILSLEGEIGAVERVRTSKKAFERMVKLIETMKADGTTAGSYSTRRCPTGSRVGRSEGARSSAPIRYSCPRSGP